MKLFDIVHIFAGLLLLSFTVFTQSDDEAAIRATMSSYCIALQKKDLAALKEAFPASVIDEWDREFERGYYAEHPVKSCIAKAIKIDGEEAIVRVFLERLEPEGKVARTGYGLNHFITTLNKTGSGWKIIKNIRAEDELIAQLLWTRSLEDRKVLIREANEVLDTFHAIDVLLFRLKNEGRYELSEEYIQLAEWWGQEFCKEDECHTDTRVTVLNALAANQVSQGNYSDALQYYTLASKLTESFRATTGKVISGAALTQINLGQLYFKQGNPDQAERFGLLALKSLEGKEPVKESVNYFYAHTLLGDIYAQRGEFERAAEYYRKQMKPRSPGIGEVYLRQGKFDDALPIFQHFVEMSENSELYKEQIDLPLAIDSYVGISDIHRQKRNSEKALKAARKAVEFAERTNDPQLVYRARTAAGKALMEMTLFIEAEKEFRAAIDSVENARRKVTGGEESRIVFLENRLEPYHQMINLLLARGDTQEALTFAERAKSRVLSEVLQAGRTDWQSVLTGKDKDNERILRERLAELNRAQTNLKYQATVDRPRLNSVTVELEKVRLEYEFAKGSAYANYPELKRSKGIGTSLGVTEIAGLIHNQDTALLEFVVTGKSINLFVATKDKLGKMDLRVFQMDGTPKDIIDLANDFRLRVSTGDLDYKSSARRLHDILLKKALPQLAGKTNLIVVPDAELWNVPFAALIGPNGRFLVEDRSLTYAQSFTALNELQNIRSGLGMAGGNLFALGNPRIDDSTIARSRSQFRSELGDLPDAVAEVTNIRKLYGRDSKSLTRLDAREDVWKSEAGKYQVLHLATHGVANSINPLYSYLFLSTDQTPTEEDGLLEAWEVMNQRLNADLVVLSACETARGRIGKGEGIIGLSWAFAVANVPRVVASQWKVESKATAEMMIAFHRSLRFFAKPDVGRALQNAMLNQMKVSGRRHPFNWAAFVVVGAN